MLIFFFNLKLTIEWYEQFIFVFLPSLWKETLDKQNIKL